MSPLISSLLVQEFFMYVCFMGVLMICYLENNRKKMEELKKSYQNVEVVLVCFVKQTPKWKNDCKRDTERLHFGS